MTAHALMYVDKATFYRFITSADADERLRYEWVRGWIMQQQAGGTLVHAQIGRRFCRVLENLLSEERWIVSGADRGIDTGITVRYADVVVEAGGASDPKSLATKTPVLLVEVLSESSEERDLSVKPEEYLALASLDTYIVASQDAVLCYVWQRRPDGTFNEAPTRIEGRDQMIQVPGLGIAIPLAEIYRGIDVT